MRAGDEPGGFEALQVHVQERPADADDARQVADVVAPAGERRHDPQPDRVRQRREHLDQRVADRLVHKT